MKGFTKNPFPKGAGRGAPVSQLDDNPFEDEEILADHLDDVVIDAGGNEEDLDFTADEYSAPRSNNKPKKGKKNKKQTSSNYETEMSFNQPHSSQPVAPAIIYNPPPHVSPIPTQPVNTASHTAFVLPPSSDSNIPPGQRKNYLNNVTNYFNEKKKQYYNNSNGGDQELGGQIDSNDPNLAAIRKREAELLAREQALIAREAQVKAIEAKQPNWPFRFYAILYHNIDDDILPENKRFIRSFYALWIFELVCIAFTLLSAMVDVFSGVMCAFGIVSLIENIVFIVAGLFGSWFLWYKVIYDASKKVAIGSVSYGRFSCGFLMHVGWVVLMLTGLWASNGIFSIIQCIGKSATSVAFMIIGTILWGINFVWSGVMSKQAYTRYKASGGTFANLKADLTKHAAKAALSRA